MAKISEAMKPFFQNLSMPWSALDEEAVPMARMGSGTVGSSSLIGSLTATAVSIGRSLATSPSSTQSWLTRKSSFKAAARTIRSVSVTTMAAAVRSPHRVASVKSAKASIMRKGSESESMCTTSSQDVTSLSMPPLESDQRAIFDLSRENSDDDESSRYCDSILSDEELNQNVSPSENEDINDQDSDNESQRQENEVEESRWAQEAFEMRHSKGRVDSTSTNEVTFINTILNKSLTLTDEGNAIRRRIAADEVETLKRQTSEDASSSATLEPPILTIEPPSPMPSSSVSPLHYRNYHHESDSETTNPVCIEVPVPTNPNWRRRRLNTGVMPKQRKSSHSFNSVRDRRRRIRSDSRSSSEPPLIVDKPPPFLDANIRSSELRPSSYPQSQSYRRSVEPSNKTGATNSRHASGENESNNTGCSPKGGFEIGLHYPLSF